MLTTGSLKVVGTRLFVSEEAGWCLYLVTVRFRSVRQKRSTVRRKSIWERDGGHGELPY